MSCSKYTPYHKAIVEGNKRLAEIPNSIFLGQQVLSENFYETLTEIAPHKRREMPVAEDMQLGISIGMALEGYLPISIYQRMDFIPRAFDQLVNHLNLFSEISKDKFNPKVIIRTTIGSKKPLDTGLQHSKDLTKLLIKAVNFPVIPLENVRDVNWAYDFAIKTDKPIILIENQDLYYV